MSSISKIVDIDQENSAVIELANREFRKDLTFALIAISKKLLEKGPKTHDIYHPFSI